MDGWILLADGTFPGSAVAVHLQVGFQVEALDVFALVSARRKSYPLESDGTFQRHLKANNNNNNNKFIFLNEFKLKWIWKKKEKKKDLDGSLFNAVGVDSGRGEGTGG